MFEEFASVLEHSPVEVGTGRRRHRVHITAEQPATEQEIQEAERRLGHSLPQDLRQFLLRWNGARVFVPEDSQGGLHPYPWVYSVGQIPNEQAPLNDPLVLVIAQLHDEGFLVLDRSDREKACWPVYWVDELDRVEKVLAHQKIADSFTEFLIRFMASRGEWYWQPMPPRAWFQDEHGIWRFGAELSLFPERAQGSPVLGLGFTSGALCADTVLAAMGLRQHLIALGGEFVDPRSVGWQPPALYWLFRFAENPVPVIRPDQVAPAALPPRQWTEMVPNLWMHGDGAVFWSRYIQMYNQPPTGTYTVTWVEGTDEIVQGLIDQLGRVSSYQSYPDVPEGMDAIEYHWWGQSGDPPIIRPVP